MPLSRESSIRTARYNFSPCFQSAIWVCSLFRKNWTSSLVTIGGLVSFLPTAVTVMATVPGPAAMPVAPKSPEIRVSTPIIRTIRLGFVFFIIVVSPFYFPICLDAKLGRNAYMEGWLHIKNGKAFALDGLRGALHGAK